MLSINGCPWTVRHWSAVWRNTSTETEKPFWFEEAFQILLSVNPNTPHTRARGQLASTVLQSLKRRQEDGSFTVSTHQCNNRISGQKPAPRPRRHPFVPPDNLPSETNAFIFAKCFHRLLRTGTVRSFLKIPLRLWLPECEEWRQLDKCHVPPK